MLVASCYGSRNVTRMHCCHGVEESKDALRWCPCLKPATIKMNGREDRSISLHMTLQLSGFSREPTIVSVESKPRAWHSWSRKTLISCKLDSLECLTDTFRSLEILFPPETNGNKQDISKLKWPHDQMAAWPKQGFLGMRTKMNQMSEKWRDT